MANRVFVRSSIWSIIATFFYNLCEVDIELEVNEFSNDEVLYMKRNISSSSLIAGSIIILMLTFNATKAQTNQESNSEKREALETTNIYKAWFEAHKNKDFARANAYALSYVNLYPNGNYTAYLKKWVKQYEREVNVDEREKALRDIKNNLIIEPKAAEKEKVYDNPRVRALLDMIKSYKFVVLESLLQNLIDGGDNINIRIKDGRTLLMLTAINQKHDAAKALIEKGIDINARDEKNGWTALVYAVWGGEPDIVQMLIDTGADVNAKDVDGVSILDMAMMKGDPEIVQIIEKALGLR